MPGEDVQSWSVTAANNANSDTSINFAEGQPRASVNNSARSMMAAHAKDRNLNNGSIVTGGTANAQTFTSGVTYTTVPTNLIVRLKIGTTNTGATTLEMDGLGAVAIKDQAGNDLSGNALIIGQYAGFLYNGTNWILLDVALGAGVVPQHGRLTVTSTTQLKFSPYQGDRIKINGVLYQIPAAGIAGLANTSVFVNGVAAQNLAVTTRYYIYAFLNSTVVTADFSTTTHATSTTGGNEGVEIKSGDDTRTLIGQVYTNASAQFENNAVNRLVINWFNRRNLTAAGGNSLGTTTTSTSFAELNVVCRAQFVTWADEDVVLGLCGFGFSPDTASPNITAGVGIDGAATVLARAASHTAAINFTESLGGMQTVSGLAEGYHFITPACAVSVGTGGFHVAVSALIRG